MYNRQSTYLTWGGTIGSSGQETWQCGIHVGLTASTDGPGLPTVAELATLLSGPLAEFHTDPTAWIAEGALLSWVKAASIDPAGHYTGESVQSTVTPFPGGSTAPARGGPQVACCITLWSGQSLGEANFGRLYWPWWEAQVDPSGRVQTALVAGQLLNAKQLLDGINTWAASALSPTARIMILSKKDAGASKQPAYVRVGDVKDTQQRRRRQIPEAYSTVALA